MCFPQHIEMATRFSPFFPLPECKRPIKQLELKIGLLAEDESGSLCLVKCNQPGDKGADLSCERYNYIINTTVQTGQAEVRK